MKYFLILLVFVSGCTTPFIERQESHRTNININQVQLGDDASDEPKTEKAVSDVTTRLNETVKTIERTLGEEASTNKTGRPCNPFKMPELPQPPPVPDISEERQDDYEYISTVLVNYIESMQEHTKDVRDVLDEAYQTHLDDCIDVSG